jgi:hypothetical protein
MFGLVFGRCEARKALALLGVRTLSEFIRDEAVHSIHQPTPGLDPCFTKHDEQV